MIERGGGKAVEDPDMRIWAAMAGQGDNGHVRCRSLVQRALRAANSGSPAAGPWAERRLAFTQDERPGGGVARISKVFERGLMLSRCRTAKSQPRIQSSARSWVTRNGTWNVTLLTSNDTSTDR